MLQFIYTAGNISAINRRTSGAWTAITGSGLAKDTDQDFEIYANNSATSTTYFRSGTQYTLSAQQWDLWNENITSQWLGKGRYRCFRNQSVGFLLLVRVERGE